MYLTKKQIESFIERIGQPQASVLLNSFFNSYRHTLTSVDVSELYDDEYLRKINNHPAYIIEKQKFKIHIYNKYTYNYLIPKLNPNSNIMDIGCGSGDFVLAISAYDVSSVVGIDFSSKAINEANIKLINNDINNCTFLCMDATQFASEVPFDYVVLNDVSEHLSDGELYQLFTKIDDILAKDGEVIIHTPNGLALCNATDSNIIQKLYVAYLKMFKKWRGHERTAEQIFYDQTHINIKSFRQLKKLLKKCKFSASVIYDEKHNPILDCLSTNMLVIAKRINKKD